MGEECGGVLPPKSCGATELKTDDSSLFLPFLLPKKHQAHPVRFSEDSRLKLSKRSGNPPPTHTLAHVHTHTHTLVCVICRDDMTQTHVPTSARRQTWSRRSNRDNRAKPELNTNASVLRDGNERRNQVGNATERYGTLWNTSAYH